MSAKGRPTATRAGIVGAIAGAAALHGLPMPWSINLYDSHTDDVFADQPDIDLWFDKDQTEHLDRWAAYLLAEGARPDESVSSDADRRRAVLVHPCGWRYGLYCERLMATARKRATSLLTHYLRLAVTSGGVRWESDNEAEVDALFDAIEQMIDTAIAKAVEVHRESEPHLYRDGSSS